MTSVNKILEFCDKGVVGTNLLSDSAYKASAKRLKGDSGIGDEQLINKAQHQYAFIAHCLAQWMADGEGAEINDTLTDAQMVSIIRDTFMNGAFPKGTKAIFVNQRGAPRGWTVVTGPETDRRMLRLVASGSSVGGLHDPTLNDKIPSHVHYFVTTNESNNHYHQTENSASTQVGQDETFFVANTRKEDVILHTSDYESEKHFHSGVTAEQHDPKGAWRPKYCKTIVCMKE